MKCPVCGTWTVVKETRGIRRRRECANEHKFTTEEVFVPQDVLKQRSLANLTQNRNNDDSCS
jgi:transcriptional regulator NrdR family protein